MSRVDITYPGDIITKSITALVRQPVSPTTAQPIDIGLVEINHPTEMIPGPAGPMGPAGPQGPVGGALVGTGDSLPPAPQGAEIFWESDTGNTFIWYDDGDSAQWVQITGIGSTTASDSPWVTPQMYGVEGDGVTLDTIDFQTCLDSAAAGKAPVYIPAGTYKIGQLVIPAGSVIRASKHAVIRGDGSTTGTQYVLDIGDNVDFDALVVSVPGTETATYLVRFGDNIRGDLFRLTADVQRSPSGIITRGQDVRIGRIEVVKVDNGFTVENLSTTPTTGTDIGFIDITSYRRAIFFINCSARVGGIRTVVRSPTATAILPGQNGLLISGCQNLEIGDCWFEDASEHSVRIGGSPAGTKTRNVRFGNITAIRSRGCVFKINPTLLVSPGVTETADNIQIGNILGIDCGGDGGAPAGNNEFLRFTHARNVQVGDVMATVHQYAVSGQTGLLINDSRNIRIASLGGPFNSGFVIFSSTSDCDGINGFAGDTIGLYIDRMFGQIAPGLNGIFVDMTYNIGDIHIRCDGARGFTSNMCRWSVGLPLADVFRISGWIGGAVPPAFQDPPDDPQCQLDITWQGKRFMGPAYGLSLPALGIAPPAFVPTSAPTSGLTINNVHAPAGAGLYGSGIEWTRLASARRGAAIVARQSTADSKQVGLDFFVGNSPSAANEILSFAMRLNYDQRVVLDITRPVYANNAAAVTGGLTPGSLYWTATGEARIVV